MPWHGRFPMNVRYRDDIGFEMRCEDCAAKGYSPYFWPLDVEFWDVSRGMTRCRSCWMAKKRLDELARAKLLGPEHKRKKERIYHAKNRDKINAQRRRRRVERQAEMAAANYERLAARDGGDDEC